MRNLYICIQLVLVCTHLAAAWGCLDVSSPDACGGDCAKAITDAVNGCSSKGGGIVHLGIGVYPLGSSSTDTFSALVVLSNATNVTLSGVPTGGTILELAGLSPGILIQDSKNIILKGISITSRRQPYTYGIATAVTQGSVTIQFDPAMYPFPSTPYAWMLQAEAVTEFDNVTWRGPPTNGIDMYELANPINLTMLSTDHLVLDAGTDKDPRFAVGKWYILRHAVYGKNALTIQSSLDVTVADFQLFGNPGMGCYAADSSNILLSNFGVRRLPGYPMSITADGAHFNQCGGVLKLEGCHIEGQGDDGINVHGMFHAVAELGQTPGQGMILSNRPAGGSYGALNVGEVYQFRNRTTWAIEGEATLVAASNYGRAGQFLQRADFSFKGGTAAARNITKFALLANMKRQPAVHIVGTYFGQNRARGALLKTSNVLVEDSVFDHPSDHCIQAFPDGCFWFESNGFSNWTVRNNTITGCRNSADIFVAACQPRWLPSGLPSASGDPVTVGQPFAGMTIAQNRFLQDEPQAAVAVWGAAGITVQENVVTVLSSQPAASSPPPSPSLLQPASHADPSFSSAPKSTSAHSSAPPFPMLSSLDGFSVSTTTALVHGWVVDNGLKHPTVSSTVIIKVNGAPVLQALANASRPDLVPKVAPDPHHGFELSLPPSAVKLLQSGNHSVSAWAIRADGSHVQLQRSPACITNERRTCTFPQDCACGAPLPTKFQLSNSLDCVVRGNVCDGKPCSQPDPAGCKGEAVALTVPVPRSETLYRAPSTATARPLPPSTLASAICRDPYRFPFGSSSLWNVAIGSNAVFVAANIYPMLPGPAQSAAGGSLSSGPSRTGNIGAEVQSLLGSCANESSHPQTRHTCPGAFGGITKAQCEAKGCCFANHCIDSTTPNGTAARSMRDNGRLSCPWCFTPTRENGPNSFHNDEEFIVAVKQTDPEVTWFVQGWWGSPQCPTGVEPTPNNCYCHCLQSPRAVPHEGKIQLPVEFLTNTSVYCAGNNGLSMVQPDGVTVMQTQPAYRCTPGGPLFSQSNGTVGCPQPHPLTVDIRSNGTETALGAHGGSGLSAFGGSIRLHEIEPDAPPIRHAIKLELFAHAYYYGGPVSLNPHTAANGGRTQYVWPATGSDAYTFETGSRLKYNGTNPHLAPGALLAIPDAASTALLPTLQTAPGRRIAAVLRDYGGYLVDDTASDSAAICFESGAHLRFESLYNISLNTAGGPWYTDLVKIFQRLEIVSNNRPGSVGGGGTPRLPPLPPLCD